MHKPVDMNLWRGRVDDEETSDALRWHQLVVPLDDQSWPDSKVLLGFCCDEGVKRNKGRVGAAAGPDAIRKALSNLSYGDDKSVYDAGNIYCVAGDMEGSQAELAREVSGLLRRKMNVTVLGGGHETAWGSFQGIVHHLKEMPRTASRLGIINFDAHLDLRNPVSGTSSGTPFRQISEWCENHDREFNYHVMGINPSANTAALFQYAQQQHATWVEDVDTHVANIEALKNNLEQFVSRVDFIYITICLDVFAAAIAPGVSAPAAVGVSGDIVIRLVREIHSLSKQLNVPIILSDIVEMNPAYDIEGRTARLAARLVWELSNPPH
ncbi:MAG: formimidoylglutamase [Pseudomonadales bacterium]|jgi:formiminoglutamase